jgi:hypothetical protein
MENLPNSGLFGFGNLADTWYSKNWGCPGEAYNIKIKKRKDNYAIIEFNTSWSSPYIWVETVSKIIDDVQFKLLWANENFPISGKVTNHKTEFYKNDIAFAVSFVKKHFFDFDTFREQKKYFKKYYNIDITKAEHYESDDDILEDN